jgi:uncharacterized membrane protein
VTRGRLLILALVLSLALNLFVASRFLAHVVMGPFGPPPPEIALPHLVEELAGRLPVADAALVRRVFGAHAAEISERSRAVGRAHDHIRKTLDQEPFDPNALNAALDEVRDTELGLHGAVQATIAEIAPQLSAGARHSLAAWAPGGPPP